MNIIFGLLLLVSLLMTERTDRFVVAAAQSLPASVDISAAFSVQNGTRTVLVGGGGSGVFISPDGYVLTVAHIFDSGTLTGISVCEYNGTCSAGELKYIAPNKDLALIKIDTWNKAVPFVSVIDPRKVRVGQEVISIGSPLGFAFTATHGMISALHRDTPQYNLIQMDAMSGEGSSGGPVLNLQGQLLGITHGFATPVRDLPINSGLNFAISSGQILEFLIDARKQYKDLVFKRV